MGAEMTDVGHGYHISGFDGYWVVSRMGYDLIAFETEAEAQAEYDRLVERWRANEKGDDVQTRSS